MGCLFAIIGVALALLVGVPVSVDGPTAGPTTGPSEVVVREGGDWRVVVTVDGDDLCSEVHDASGGGGVCVMAVDLPPDAFILVGGSGEPPVLHGVVREDVARITWRGSGVTGVESGLVSLAHIGVDARAFAIEVPTGIDVIEELVALAEDGRPLGRAAGPAATPAPTGPTPA